MGKLKHRAGFLESLQGEEAPVYRDQVSFQEESPVYMYGSGSSMFPSFVVVETQFRSLNRFMVKSG